MQTRGWMLVAALLAAGACAPYRSWPPAETGRTDPTYEPLPTLMTEGVRYGQKQFEPGAEVVRYNLPEGTPPQVYEEISRRLGGTAEPLTVAGEPAIHVESVRARGADAEVDLVVPSDGRYELVTVYFALDVLKGWQLRNARTWRIPRDEPLPHYRPEVARTSVAGAPDPRGPRAP